MNITSHFNARDLNASYTKTVEKSTTSPLSVIDTHKQLQTQSFSYSFVSLDFQSATTNDTFEKNYAEFQDFLSEIGYEGGPIASLSQEDAQALVSEDGFFGINKTAQRIADFVLNGAGDNEDLLRAGREGILQGFDEAEAMWGDKLPDISYKTIEKAVEIIDLAMHDMGYSIINEEA